MMFLIRVAGTRPKAWNFAEHGRILIILFNDSKKAEE
jgi:hypothetical protein